ncbi:hypothetical protein JHK86_001378 [Glycine max]|nr:hypothetical protein JHK86_001378 [Glycine max]
MLRLSLNSSGLEELLLGFENMLKQAIGKICKTDVYACEGNKVLPWIYVPSSFFHHGQVKSPILPFKSQFLFFIYIFYYRISHLSVY